MMQVIRRLMMTNVATSRTCGTCTECCRLPAISEKFSNGIPYEKPSGEMCKHCTGKGCGIHDKRPDLCRGFFCSYLMGIDEKRPEDTGVVWSIQPKHTLDGPAVLVVGYCDDVGKSLEREDVRGQIGWYAKDPLVDAITLRSAVEAVCFTVIDGMPVSCRAKIDPDDKLKHEILDSSEETYGRWVMNNQGEIVKGPAYE